MKLVSVMCAAICFITAGVDFYYNLNDLGFLMIAMGLFNIFAYWIQTQKQKYTK